MPYKSDTRALITRRLCPLLLGSLAALGLAAAPTTHAQTVLTGHHDGNASGDGYDATNSATTYVVNADTAAGPSATFNSNQGYGLYVNSSSVTVSGGQFNSNKNFGLGIFYSTGTISGGQFNGNAGVNGYGVRVFNSSVTVTGGQFNNNAYEGISTEVAGDVLTITGGQFSNDNDAGVAADGGTVVVRGGQFSGNNLDFKAFGPLDIYGEFDGMSVGQTQTLSAVRGSFTGTLQMNTSPGQTFTYYNANNFITLHDVAPAPEPSSVTALWLGALALGGLTLRARRRATI